MRIRNRLAALLVGVMSLGAVVAVIPSGGAAAEPTPATHRPPKPPRMTCEEARATGNPGLIKKYCSS